jgi:hypothetical protein
MNCRQTGPRFARSAIGSAAFALLLAFVAAPTQAAMIEIQFTGMNLVYDGSAIYDAGSTNGGLANPADADPLSSVEFSVDGTPVGAITSDISLDLHIPDVTGIPVGAGVVFNTTTPGNPGFFDLLIGTSPLASEFMLVGLGEVNITYVDVLNIVQFTFGAAVSNVFAANLPFGLEIGDPITVSFSAQVTPGTLTNDGTFITGFRATGTGEIRGTLIPEPSACVLAGLGLIAFAASRRRA